ncbi:hypothetical protein [Streptomyces sp. NPDC048623]|uniref:hypothetical protein n=1 Tax=Streptomyces sp. NPDC048623 TaxID=3155761 RepID=UPI0034256AD2
MTTASTPVLRGKDQTVLRHEGTSLTLRREDEEIRIPLRAVRDLVPDGRALTVELHAPTGATPATHRIEGVNQASVDLFATTVGRELSRLPEPDPSLDGATLVTTRSLRPAAPAEDLPQIGTARKARALGWILLALVPGVGATVATSVLVVRAGEPGALPLSVVLGIVAVLLNLCSGMLTERIFQMWVLPRRGITVMAVRNNSYGKTGFYEYTDLSGMTYNHTRQAYASEIEICYHPDNPAENVGVYPVFTRVVITFGALLLWGVTLGLCTLMILLGGYA